jgi:hypothetical protein
MADSLVIAGTIEALGGGVPSQHPLCEGAIFRLRQDFDLSSPPPGVGDIANMLLPSDQGTARTITLPVAIVVPPTGDPVADRSTLIGARELLLLSVAADEWPLTWTRDGTDLPMVFDCFEAQAAVVEYSLIRDRQLVSLVAVTFNALPYGRSTVQETINFPAPAQNFDQPPAPVAIDGYATNSNFLASTAGFASTDDAYFNTTIGQWQPVTACTVAWSATNPNTGRTGDMLMTATSAASMSARSCPVTDPVALAASAMQANPGDSVTVRGSARALVTARSVNVGAEFYDAFGALLTTLRGSNVTNTTTGYTQATAALTAPANTYWAVPVVQVVTPANGEQHRWADVWIDEGPVYSADDPQQWTTSTQTAVSGGRSARWSRKTGDCPVYDHTLPAAVDITGRTRLTVWVGLATTTAQYPVWHKGTVSVSALLRDGTGQTLEMPAVKRECQASQIPGKPHWQLVTFVIPQVPSGFDYTTVSSYRLQVWNHWNPKGGTGQGGLELQAGLFLNALTAAPPATGTYLARGGWYQMPGIVGTAPAPVAVLAQPGPSSFSTVVEFTTAGSNPWTAPSGLTKVDKAESWAAGASGAGSQSNPNNNGAGGGGAGEYAAEYNVPVVALSSYPFVVGAAGAATSAGQVGNNGGDSYWSGSSGPQVRAHGGHGGWSSTTWGGGKGGSGSTNAVHYSGGDGCQANANNQGTGQGGGGGGSGAPGQAGEDGGWGGSVRNPGRARAQGGPGGQGGTKDGSYGGFDGDTPLTGPGGGGGGGANEGGAGGFHGGSAGRAGKGRLTYGATGLLPLASLLIHTPGRGAPEALQPLIPVGAGADLPDGREYTVPVTGAINGRFDGTYTIYLVAGTWNTPGSARNLTVTIRQYPYSGGTAVVQALTLNGVVPNTDVTNGYVDMGVVSLPLSAIAAGNITDSYFTVGVTSSNASDRFLDVLTLDLAGRTLLVNVPGSSVFNSIWVDEPDHDRNLGGVYGSDADRDRAVSAFRYIERISGGPFAIRPASNNRVLVYSAQGCPAVQFVYLPRWRLDRLS